MANWTASDIPSQQGRSAVVTGTGGLGLEDALALARAGADIIIAGRDPKKGEAALALVHERVPSARIRFEQLDLASLGSVAAFATRLGKSQDSLDILINNAGVMVPPTRQTTIDGFELQFGTNYLGHFALTAHLMPLLLKGHRPRVVSLSSVAARQGVMNLDDLQSENDHAPMRAYAQSKLACLMFAFELQRQSNAHGWGLASLAAHPGIARTNLLHNAPGRRSAARLARSLLWFLFQPAAQGALPTLFAATAPNASPGAYYGPGSLNEARGYPRLAKVPPQAADEGMAARLWQASETLAGVAFPKVEPRAA